MRFEIRLSDSTVALYRSKLIKGRWVAGVFLSPEKPSAVVELEGDLLELYQTEINEQGQLTLLIKETQEPLSYGAKEQESEEAEEVMEGPDA